MVVQLLHGCPTWWTIWTAGIDWNVMVGWGTVIAYGIEQDVQEEIAIIEPAMSWLYICSWHAHSPLHNIIFVIWLGGLTPTRIYSSPSWLFTLHVIWWCVCVCLYVGTLYNDVHSTYTTNVNSCCWWYTKYSVLVHTLRLSWSIYYLASVPDLPHCAWFNCAGVKTRNDWDETWHSNYKTCTHT